MEQQRYLLTPEKVSYQNLSVIRQDGFGGLWGNPAATSADRGFQKFGVDQMGHQQ